ncbi:MAG TPA: hypothetical protein VIH58_12300 [Chthoniobacterales bacterium]
METQTQLETTADAHTQTSVGSIPHWSLGKRVAFRFCFAYIALYAFPFPLSFIPYSGVVFNKYQSLWKAIVPWVGKHILHLSYDITILPNGSGDTTWNYVQVFCFLVLAVTITVIWSVLDRRRAGYGRFYQWFRLVVRFYLASALLTYGLIKVIPLQMPAPLLSTLLEPYGESSPMGLLWTFIGASKGYEMFVGFAEVAGGLLLTLPRTTALGALIGVADMLQVFVLNMCYDVPVKLYSFHLLAVGIFLIAPELGRLGNLFIRGRQVELTKAPPMFKRLALNRGLLALQVVFGLYLVGSGLWANYQRAKEYGFLAPKPPLYGIWQVDEYVVDGQVRPPVLDDEARWRRVIFDAFPGSLGIQLVGGARQRFRIQVDTDKKTIQFAKREDPTAKSDFSFEEPGEGLMTLAGDMDGHKITAKLRKTPESEFLLQTRGFHWINEVSFNR